MRGYFLVAFDKHQHQHDDFISRISKKNDIKNNDNPKHAGFNPLFAHSFFAIDDFFNHC